MGEKALGQILGVVWAAALLAKETVEWRPVDCAQLLQGFPGTGLLLIAAGKMRLQ